jgi:predicted dinucleotide-binding enzyme
MTTLGTIGAGHIGTAVARAAIAAGYDVVLSNSRGPETLADLVAELGPQASAGTALRSAERGDIVVVTIPLKNYRDVPTTPLTGKIVIDTNNYSPQPTATSRSWTASRPRSANCSRHICPARTWSRRSTTSARPTWPLKASRLVAGRWPSPATTPRPRQPSPH